VAGASSKAQAEGRTLVWVDESGLYLLPAAVRTYAPVAQTPVLRVPLTRDHLSAISAITEDGRLLMAIRARSVRGPDVVRFLRHVLRRLPGPLLVLWDGSPIHRAQPVKEFLAAGAAGRVHLEQLPAYAAELNPDERLWRQWRPNVTHNHTRATLAELQGDSDRWLGRIAAVPRAVLRALASPVVRYLRTGFGDPGLALFGTDRDDEIRRRTTES
jgi:transposase